MSSESSYPRCAVDVRSSRLLFLYALLLTGAALLAPWIAGAPPIAALFLDAPVAAFAPSLFRWSRGSLSRMVWFPGGRWLLVDREGREHEADRLREGVVVGARLVALRWRCECCGKRFRVALLEDNCDADSLRRLVVRLRATADDELFGRQNQVEDVAGQ